MVDRAARDRLASTLAAYLRGETDNFALDEAGIGSPTEDHTLTDLGWALWYCYDDVKAHRISALPLEWEFMRRTVAFLRTDLELPRETGSLRWFHPAQAWGAFSAVTIVAAVVAACRGSEWWLLAPGVLVGVPFAAYMHVDAARGEPPENLWYPFEDEAQWRAHEHLAAAERLPPYDERLHARPIHGRLVTTLVGILSLLLWAPLLSLAFLLPRRQTKRPAPTA